MRTTVLMLVKSRLVISAILSLPAISSHSQTTFRFAMEPGPYGVGLKVVQQYDYTRTFRAAVDDLGHPTIGERARPLQTVIWYPATKSSKPSMTVEDYEGLLATETDFSGSGIPDSWKSWVAALAPTRKDHLWAVRDAQAIAERFPVVIYAPSFGSMAWENADLCELLASHGYLVIAAPDMGAKARGMTLDVEGLNAQAADISFLIGFARTLPNADISKVAVAGFSWGGLSNVLAATRDNRIDALVGLDGSLRYFAGIAKQAGIHPEQMTIPMLYFTQGELSLENIERNHSAPSQVGPNILNRWTHGDLMTVHDLALNHVEHSSMYQRNEDTWKRFPEEQKGDYDRSDGAVGYAWMARYMWKFLDAYLKNDVDAMAFLKRSPAENRAPKHILAAEFRAALGVAPTLDGLRQGCEKRGFDQAIEVYKDARREDSDFKPSQPELTDWAQRLTAARHSHEAMGVWRLIVYLYPDSSDAGKSLAEAYLLEGQKQLAIQTYLELLRIHPDDQSSQLRLRMLERTAP